LVIDFIGVTRFRAAFAVDSGIRTINIVHILRAAPTARQKVRGRRRDCLRVGKEERKREGRYGEQSFLLEIDCHICWGMQIFLCTILKLAE
jgi:hypothetical protein